MLTNKQGKVADSQQITFALGRPQLKKVIKNEASIRQEYECFKGNLKKNRKGHFQKINKILWEWFIMCCKAIIYLDGQMLKQMKNII